MRTGKGIKILVFAFVLFILTPGCGLTKRIDSDIKIEVTTGPTDDYSGPLDGENELVWNEKTMFGLNNPGGVMKDHFVNLQGQCYIMEEMTTDQIEACIQEIKDLGFTLEPKEKEYCYEAFHEKQTNRRLSIFYYDNTDTPDQIWIESSQ